jgi:hypothetical protein
MASLRLRICPAGAGQSNLQATWFYSKKTSFACLALVALRPPQAETKANILYFKSLLLHL